MVFDADLRVVGTMGEFPETVQGALLEELSPCPRMLDELIGRYSHVMDTQTGMAFLSPCPQTGELVRVMAAPMGQGVAIGTFELSAPPDTNVVPIHHGVVRGVEGRGKERPVQPAPEIPTDAELLAYALPILRRLSHCDSLPALSRCSADVLARTVETFAPAPPLRSVAPASSRSAEAGPPRRPLLALAKQASDQSPAP